MTDETGKLIEIKNLDQDIVKLVTDNFRELLQSSKPVENLEKKKLVDDINNYLTELVSRLYCMTCLSPEECSPEFKLLSEHLYKLRIIMNRHA